MDPHHVNQKSWDFVCAALLITASEESVHSMPKNFRAMKFLNWKAIETSAFTFCRIKR